MNWTNQKVIELADANPDGFTVDVNSGEKQTHGYVVGMTHGLTPEDAATVANIMKHSQWHPAAVIHWTLGGWRDGDRYVIDIGFTCGDLEVAIDIGLSYHQDAIYDIDNEMTIYLKGVA